MISIRMLVCSAIFASLVPTNAPAAGCSASGGAGELKITTRAQVPSGLRALKTPSSVAKSLAGSGGTSASDPTIWRTLDNICSDWIVICSDPDCNHGVADCDGECIEF